MSDPGRATLFVVFDGAEAEVSAADWARVARALDALSGLCAALAFTPLPPGDQPYAKDGRGPALALQLDFADAQARSEAVAAASPLADIVAPGALVSLAGSRPAWQAMRGRRFGVPDPRFRLAPGRGPCTFLVEYPGETENLGAWLDHYDAHHPAIMARFPAVRAVETFRPEPLVGAGLRGRQARAMQRNKVVFDTREALEAALASPIMLEMRADFAKFPQTSMRPTHFVMDTRLLAGG